MEKSDEALIVAHREGDSDALASLIARYSALLQGYLIRMTGNRTQAEDLFQEVFLRVHRNAHRYRENSRFKTWLFQIATHAAIDHWRACRRRPVTLSFHDPAGIAVAGAAASDGPDPAETLARAELREQVRAAVFALPDRQRTALVLSYFEGFTYRDAAEIMKCSESSVKTHVARALRTLAQNLPDPDTGRQSAATGRKRDLNSNMTGCATA